MKSNTEQTQVTTDLEAAQAAQADAVVESCNLSRKTSPEPFFKAVAESFGPLAEAGLSGKDLEAAKDTVAIDSIACLMAPLVAKLIVKMQGRPPTDLIAVIQGCFEHHNKLVMVYATAMAQNELAEG